MVSRVRPQQRTLVVRPSSLSLSCRELTQPNENVAGSIQSDDGQSRLKQVSRVARQSPDGRCHRESDGQARMPAARSAEASGAHGAHTGDRELREGLEWPACLPQLLASSNVSIMLCKLISACSDKTCCTTCTGSSREPFLEPNHRLLLVHQWERDSPPTWKERSSSSTTCVAEGWKHLLRVPVGSFGSSLTRQLDGYLWYATAPVLQVNEASKL